MIWHYIEIWLLLVAGFFSGCVAGTMLRHGLAMTRYAERQEEVAESIDEALQRFRGWIGRIPLWQRVSPARQSVADGFAVDAHGGSEAALPPPDWEATPVAGEDTVRFSPFEPATVEEPAWDTVASSNDGLAGDFEEEAVPDDDGGVLAGRPAATAPPPADQQGTRPPALETPRNGVPDDLQRIHGIGSRNEALLNRLGIFHFAQIAAWTPSEALWVSQQLEFPQRLYRDDWIGQATILAGGGDTDPTP